MAVVVVTMLLPDPRNGAFLHIVPLSADAEKSIKRARNGRFLQKGIATLTLVVRFKDLYGRYGISFGTSRQCPYTFDACLDVSARQFWITADRHTGDVLIAGNATRATLLSDSFKSCAPSDIREKERPLLQPAVISFGDANRYRFRAIPYRREKDSLQYVQEHMLSWAKTIPMQPAPLRVTDSQGEMAGPVTPRTGPADKEARSHVGRPMSEPFVPHHVHHGRTTIQRPSTSSPTICVLCQDAGHLEVHLGCRYPTNL